MMSQLTFPLSDIVPPLHLQSISFLSLVNGPDGPPRLLFAFVEISSRESDDLVDFFGSINEVPLLFSVSSQLGRFLFRE